MKTKTDSGIKETTADFVDAQGQVEFVFDRYRSGARMAEGARVMAASYSEAVLKVRGLFHEKSCANDTFRLRHRISVHSSNEAIAAPSSPKSDISSPIALQRTLNRFMGIK